MSSAALLASPPSGIFPDWIPADQFLPNTPRIVLATDGEGIFTAVCETGADRCFTDHVEWFNASTDDGFDSVIIAWMEAPLPPDHANAAPAPAPAYNPECDADGAPRPDEERPYWLARAVLSPSPSVAS
jgi:hypothetical protein